VVSLQAARYRVQARMILVSVVLAVAVAIGHAAARRWARLAALRRSHSASQS
jgi:hypothetical protein